MIIKEVSARSILDSRKQPTIEVNVNGQKASAPAGKSTGKYETPSYHISLEWNIKSINSFPELKKLEIDSFQDLEKLESLIKKKFNLKDAREFGANALFALESAILKALARSKKKELWEIINPSSKRIPLPLGNAVGGGVHSHNENRPTFQEFLLIPQLNSMKENFKLMREVHKSLKQKLASKAKNDEGAWQTPLQEEEILKILSSFKDIKIGLDVAASSFYKNGSYIYNSRRLSRMQQIDFIRLLIKKYPIEYIEDPLEEKDFAGFCRVLKNSSSLICGDDLTVTHLSRVKRAFKTKSIDALIVKPNQNGSLLEVAEIVKFCKLNNIKTIFSHRSGETLDTAIADLAFGFQADYVKFGISGKVREVKLKRLVEIENSLR